MKSWIQRVAYWYCANFETPPSIDISVLQGLWHLYVKVEVLKIVTIGSHGKWPETHGKGRLILMLPSTLDTKELIESINNYYYLNWIYLNKMNVYDFRILWFVWFDWLGKVGCGYAIIKETRIQQIAGNAGVPYEFDDGDVSDESNRQVIEWLVHHMDDAPFHKLCYDASITTKYINNYLTENGTDAAVASNPIHGLTPFHMLSMNPHAPADAIAALFESNTEATFREDNKGKPPLD